MPTSRSTRIALYVYGVLVIFFLYLPLVSVAFASVSRARYLSFPIKKYSTKWYGEALESSTVSDLLATSLSVAILVTIISVVIAFFGRAKSLAINCGESYLTIHGQNIWLLAVIKVFRVGKNLDWKLTFATPTTCNGKIKDFVSPVCD